MKGNTQRWIGTGAMGILLALGSTAVFAQNTQTNPNNQNTQNPPAQQQQQPDNKQNNNGTLTNSTGLTMDAAPPPVSAEEDAAFKAYSAIPITDSDKKISAGEDFLKKYPESRYRPPIYANLTIMYVQTGQAEKAMDAGDKEVQLQPNDVATLAILCQTIPRTINSSTPNPNDLLAKAETYGKRALDVTPTLPKPETVSDADFTSVKNRTMAMAHGGLGLVDIRRGKFSEAVPELEQSVKLVPDPDPVNYYLLGVANQNTSHFDDAQTAYKKCAEIPSGLQQRCQQSADEAKKQGASQMSAPH
jgi:tetratricopeptide (TPR) repeat protein